MKKTNIHPPFVSLTALTATLSRLLPLFILFAATVYPVPCRAEIIDRVVAVVNDDVITLSELEQEGKNLFQKIAQELPASQIQPALAEARKEILSGLIDQMLIKQRAQELDLTITEDDINEAINRILERSNATLADLQHDLEASGTTEKEYREKLRIQILQSRLVSYEVRSKIVITEEKIKDYYNTHYVSESKDGYHILQMGFEWSDDGTSQSKEEARVRAENIRRMVVDGKNFQELAKSFSDLPSAADGGDIGVFQEDELAPHMREVIMSLQPGEISDIVEIKGGGGYQFFKLLSSKAGEIVYQAPFEQVKEEIKEVLQEEELRQQFDQWVKDIRDEAYIVKLL